MPLLLFVAAWGAGGLLLGLLARTARSNGLLLLSCSRSASVARATSRHGVSIARRPAGLAPLGLPGGGSARAVCAAAAARGARRRDLRRGRARAAVPGAAVLAGRSLPSGWWGSPTRCSPRTTGRSSRRSRRTRCARHGGARRPAGTGAARRRPAVWRAEAGARGRSRSALLGGSIVLHRVPRLQLRRRGDHALAVVLVAQRHEFDAPGDPATRPRPRLARRLLAAGIFAYGALALWAQPARDRPAVSLGLISRETGAALLGLRFHGSTHLAGRFGDWFPLSVFFAALAVRLAAAAAGSHRGATACARRRRERRARAASSRLGRRHARAFRAPGGQVVLLLDRRAAPFSPTASSAASRSSPATRSGRRGVRHELARPVPRLRPQSEAGGCASSARPSAASSCTGARAAFALPRRRGGRRDRRRSRSRAGAIRKVRQSVHRLASAGYRARVLRPRAIDRRCATSSRGSRANGAARAGAWLRDGARRALPARRRGRALRRRHDAGGAPAGFLHFAVCPAGGALSLSSMPRLR